MNNSSNLSPVDWFASWFDTPYYHALYAHRDHNEAEAFIAVLHNHLGITSSSIVMDLACGKGRHAAALAELGAQVTGLDLSGQSIESARQLAHDALRFDVHDMREVYAESHFDFILNLFTSFGYFSDTQDNLKMLKSVKAQLKPDGVFLMDYLNAHKVMSELDSEVHTLERGGFVFKTKKSIQGGKVIKDIEVNDAEETFHFQESVQLFGQEELRGLCREAGLELISMHGDYNLASFQADSSPRTILIARCSDDY